MKAPLFIQKAGEQRRLDLVYFSPHAFRAYLLGYHLLLAILYTLRRRAKTDAKGMKSYSALTSDSK